MPGSPLQPQAGVLLFFGFVVGLGKIHQGYCLRPSASPKIKIPPAIPEINFGNRSRFKKRKMPRAKKFTLGISANVYSSKLIFRGTQLRDHAEIFQRRGVTFNFSTRRDLF